MKRANRDHPEKDHSTFYDLRIHAFLPGKFWEALPFSCGFGAIRHEHAAGSYFVDEALRPAFDARFDDLGRFSNGLAAVYQDADAGYIDTTGRMSLLLPYERLNRSTSTAWRSRIATSRNGISTSSIERGGHGSPGWRRRSTGKGTSRISRSRRIARRRFII